MMNLGQIFAFLGWYFNFISADIFMLLVTPKMFVEMWASQSRGQKSHIGIVFMQFSVVVGMLLNILALVNFDNFYLKQKISVVISTLCFLWVMLLLKN